MTAQEMQAQELRGLGYIVSEAQEEDFASDEFVYRGDMEARDFKRLQRAFDRHKAKKVMRRFAMRTSYALSVFCFFAGAIACGESEHPVWCIMTAVAVCFGGMIAFYVLAEVIDRG